MLETIMQTAPPEAYERIVSPVIMPQMSLKLRKEKSYRDRTKPPKKKAKRTEKELDETPFAPLLGKLFDCST